MPATTKRSTKQKKKPTAGGSTENASSADRLETYRAKRDFEVTPEPRSSQDDADGGKKSAEPAGPETAGTLAFVVQKHDARRLHYDVRLEVEGAMVSWAVPKGPSFDPAVRRLAVQTEDHPMGYNAFEGRIPDGEYGAGDVLIWDRGTYETVPPGQQRAMLDKGHMHVRLFGEKLVGDWHFIKTNRQGGADDGTGKPGKAQWLMFKAKDLRANPRFDVVVERPESVVSGRAATRGPLRVGASDQGKSARALLEFVGEPALATADAKITRGNDWLYEIKYDGYRLFAGKAGGDVRLFTRRAHDWTDRFGPVAEGVARLPARECVIDGEACVVDAKGRPSFGALQDWLASAAVGKPKSAVILYAVFDLLWLDGRDLRREPIELRRELLEGLMRGATPPLTLSRAVEGRLDELLAAAKANGLEGLIAKRRGSPYVAGRSGQWLKLRFDRRQDCAIAGYVPMANTKNDVGALLLGVVDRARPDTLVFAGRVGTGFDSATRRDLGIQLNESRVDAPSVEGAPKIKDARWVTPTLVCDCAFSEWTREGSMRQPRYLGLREDKTPLECLRDTIDADEAITAGPAEAEGDAPGAEGADAEGAEPDAVGAESPVARHQAAPAMAPAPAPHSPYSPRPGLKLANPDKVLFPRDGISKREIWDYYTAIAPLMLPHLMGRPLTLQRYPNGIDKAEWYQQNAPDKTPDFVRLVDTGPRHENKKRIVADNVETLQWLANLAALTIHVWCAHVPPAARTRAAIDQAIGQPDYVVLDLDPGDGPWSHLVEVAVHVRALLDALKIESFPKTSGKRGVHVVVPIAPGATHDEATGFAEQIARAVAKVLPKVATVERMKDKRGGKLYVDYGQNGEGRTVVAPYTIRARDGAVVSTPIAWDELTEELDPRRFTIRTVLERVKERGDLYAGVLRVKQKLPRV
ncbi:MAG TPA: DNA ligase D [Polyangiaceae bacterium]|nr:DNA ligase D [Polyangiaceae bacterium]